jgi:hypothetical protein
MTDYHVLDPDTRAIALVGRFLQLWAIMEAGIDQAIATGLNVTQIVQHVLGKNMDFADKIFVLRCLCSISYLLDDEKAHIETLLNRIHGFYMNRNIVAHDMFFRSSMTDGVGFLAMRARGKISSPDIDWSVAQFEELFLSLLDFTSDLQELNKKLSGAKRLQANSLPALLSAIPPSPIGEPDCAYESAKTGKAAAPARQRTTRRVRRREGLLALIREGLLTLIRENPSGLSRGEILERLGLRGNKTGERSVSNALTALTNVGQVNRQGGKYRIAA